MATPENKRKAEESSAKEEVDNEVQDAKRLKLNGGASVSGLSGEAMKPKPAVDMSVLEKAKKALQMQQGLKEKLARLKQAKAAPTAMAPGMGSKRPGATKLPPPLVVDEQGREVGASSLHASEVQEISRAPFLLQHEPDEIDTTHFDPALGNRGIRRLQRPARPALQFVEEGKFQRQAEVARLKAEFGDDYVRELEERRAREKQEERAAGGLDANLVPLGARPEGLLAPLEEPPEEVPDVEWWDAKILVDRSSYFGSRSDAIAAGGASHTPSPEISLDRITHYVEHPVLLDPPMEAAPPPPQPLRLTRRELKKLRTQRRQAREAEKQELIRQGLLEPPKPKVKISNLMRVLGAEAATDPTAIEAEVRRQMIERATAHEDRNLARKLTPAERRQKKLKKLLDRPPPALTPHDGSGGAAVVEGGETHVAVYKVGALSTPQLRFKVEVNAKENHMTGTCVIVPGAFCVVVVEGGPKTLRRYEKLMCRRIDWNATGADEGGAADAMANDEPGATPAAAASNYCYLVWTGVVKEAAFKGKFKTEEVRNEAGARRVFEERGVVHYWDLAAAYQSIHT